MTKISEAAVVQFQITLNCKKKRHMTLCLKKKSEGKKGIMHLLGLRKSFVRFNKK